LVLINALFVKNRQEERTNWFVITGAISICFNVKVLRAKSSAAAPRDRDKLDQ